MGATKKIRHEWTVAELMLAESTMADEWRRTAQAAGRGAVASLDDARIAAITMHRAYAETLPGTSDGQSPLIAMTHGQVVGVRAAFRAALGGEKPPGDIAGDPSACMAMTCPAAEWLQDVRTLLLIGAGCDWVLQTLGARDVMKIALAGAIMQLPVYHGEAMRRAGEWVGGRPTLVEMAALWLPHDHATRVVLPRIGGWRQVRDDFARQMVGDANDSNLEVRGLGGTKGGSAELRKRAAESAKEIAEKIGKVPVDARDIPEAEVPAELLERWRTECVALKHFEEMDDAERKADPEADARAAAAALGAKGLRMFEPESQSGPERSRRSIEAWFAARQDGQAGEFDNPSLYSLASVVMRRLRK